jgi:uncharacterized membrane protein HdeD (DUF308 family)
MLKNVMRVLGVVFVLIGLAGFFNPLPDQLHLTAPHNWGHLVSGLIFLGVSNYEEYSRWVARIFGIVYGLTAILGLFVHDIFGLVMATPTVEVIHFILAAITLYTGFKPSSSGKNQSQSA